MGKYFKSLAKVFLIIFCYLLLQVLVAAVFAAVGGSGAGGDIMGAMESFIADNSSAISIAQNLLVIALLFLALRLKNKSPADELGLRPITKGQAAVSIGIGLCSAAILVAVLSLLPLPEDLKASYAEAMSLLSPGSPAVTFIAAVIVAPVTEELLFRGVIYGILKQHFPGFSAMVISSAIFGLLHGNPLWITYAFLMGLLLTMIYRRFGTIWASMLLHIAFNLCGSYIMPHT